MTVRILLADDEALVRSGLRAILDLEPDLSVVGEAASGAEAVSLTRELRPDVVLMDVRMPTLDGIAATRRILEVVDPPPRIVVVTTFENDEYVYDALREGAAAFLLKRTRAAEMVQTVRLVAQGDSLLFPAAIRDLALRHRPPAAARALSQQLTEREADVLRLMATGLSNAEIAERLFVGAETVKTHVSRVLAKLGARDRTQAVVIAYESGFTAPG
ncbi:DNA-binding NarL/FixJ family response regulator [Streptacidiphilus sp. MAP12-20]|uniref:response regulator n=1 Tax=Streptacidiphilus sp. MAP12-20 TaxID=3156299 RepID=UPI0035125AF5